MDYAPRNTIDQILSRICKAGNTKRVKRGVYWYPKIHPSLGVLSPDPLEIARAIVGKSNAKLQISGAASAKDLGLTEQVPDQFVFLSDSNYKTIKVGKSIIKIKHASPKNLIGAGILAGTIVQGIKYIGKDNIDNNMIKKLRLSVKQKDRDVLKKNKPKLPSWMHPIIDKIVHT